VRQLCPSERSWQKDTPESKFHGGKKEIELPTTAFSAIQFYFFHKETIIRFKTIEDCR